jgi:hypothetical protein
VPTIQVNPAISPAQLYAFYERNNICEARYAPERAAEVLRHPSVIVAAFEGDELVAIVRALTDGLAAVIMELSVDLRYQGAATSHRNGSLIEGDVAGLGARLGAAMLAELAARKVDFISAYIVASCEEPFYEALGFKPNTGHLVYYIDRRPYV